MRGLEMDVHRNRTGRTNLARALQDIRMGATPPPVNLRGEGGQAAPTPPKIMLGYWAMSDVRIRWTDRSRPGLPRHASIDLIQSLAVRPSSLDPLDITDNLPLYVEGYFTQRTPGPWIRRPFYARADIAHPMDWEIAGIHLRCSLKPTLEELGEMELAQPEAFPMDHPLPRWTQAIRQAPAKWVIRGSYARSPQGVHELSNLEFLSEEPPPSGEQSAQAAAAPAAQALPPSLANGMERGKTESPNWTPGRAIPHARRCQRTDPAHRIAASFR